MNRVVIIVLLSIAGLAALLLITALIWPGFLDRAVDLNNVIVGPETKLTIRPGQLLQYSYHLHESVGYTAGYTISDSKILSLKEKKIAYLHPLNMLPGMTGGDDAKGIFIFRAEKPGMVELTVKHLFRGDVESTTKFKITIR